MRRRYLVIIPTYNEVQRISVLIRSVLKVDNRLDVLIVDDSSPDGTAQVVRTEFLSDQRVFLNVRKKRMGMGSAYIHGFKHAIKNDYCAAIQMDADFSHKPESLPEFLHAIPEADLVIGSRYVRDGGVVNWSGTKRFYASLGQLFSRLAVGIPARDLTSGFKCINTEILKKINLEYLESDGFYFQIEMNFLIKKLGGRIKEIPIMFEDTRAGQSKLSSGQSLKVFMRLPGLRAKGKDHPALKNQ